MYYSLSCKIRFKALKERSRWRDDKDDTKLIFIHILPQRETIKIVMDDESDDGTIPPIDTDNGNKDADEDDEGGGDSDDDGASEEEDDDDGDDRKDAE